MTTTKSTWQVQEAKQRFSELVDCAINDGPQVVTRHGKEVVVVLRIEDYERAESSGERFKRWMIEGPVVSDEVADLLDEIVADRKRSMPRDIDLEL